MKIRSRWLALFVAAWVAGCGGGENGSGNDDSTSTPAPAPAPVPSTQRACLMEGSMTLLGQTTEIKDCLQNDGVPQAQFIETCNNIASAGTALGAPPTLTYMAACPAQAQASCKGFFGAPMSSFYYKRDAKLLADTKTSCLAQGGEWSGP